MSICLNNRWKLRLESFGGILIDITGKSRFHYLNKPAALLLELCRRAPRQQENLNLYINQLDKVTETLISKGILFHNAEGLYKPVDKLEVSEIEALMEKLPHDFLAAPFEVNLYTSLRCNVNCNFCYLSKNTRQSYGPTAMDRMLLRNILKQCKEETVFGVNFLGGEPFIDQDAIIYAINNHVGDFLISITSNGTIPPNRELLELLQFPGVDVIISIHSSIPEVHDTVTGMPGSWNRAIDTLKILTSHGVRTAVQMVATKINTEADIFSLLEISKMYGAAGFYINTPFPGTHMTLTEYKNILIPPEKYGPIALRLNNERRKHGDDFYVFPKGTYAFVYSGSIPEKESPFDEFLTRPADGITSLEILSDGNVFPGSLSLNNTTEPIGNLMGSDLKSLWYSSKFEKYRNREILLDEPCRSCRFNKFCKGGNGIVSHKLFGTETAGDIRCPTVWNHLVEAGRI